MTIKKYLPLFEKESKVYKSLQDDGHPDYQLSWNDYIKKCFESHRHYSRKETAKIIRDFINSNFVSDRDRLIFNEILKNKPLLDKLIFVEDGSYLNNRLYFDNKHLRDINGKQGCFYFEIGLDVLKDKERDDYYKLSDSLKLKFIMDNFECVFIHLINDPDRISPRFILEH
jgi:hypothetical protein